MGWFTLLKKLKLRCLALILASTITCVGVISESEIILWQNEVNVLRVPQTTANIKHAQTVDQKEQLPEQNPENVLMQSSQQNIYLTSQSILNIPLMILG